MKKVGLGGSCHWCTEAIFSALKGVGNVEQGWISSFGENSTFSEAILVYYDPKVIPYSTVLEIHLQTHKCTSNHSMRGKYRSAVYLFEEEEYGLTQNIIKGLQPLFNAPIITKILPFNAFKLNDETYLNYYNKNPNKPFCETYIKPKLQKLLKEYTIYVK